MATNPLAATYPSGFTNGLTVRGVPINVAHPGEVFWVSSTEGGDGQAGTYQRPWATLDYAIGRCVAGRGDVIMVKPGHAENVATAGAITMDIAGVAVVGLGTIASRPTFSFTALAGSIVVSAANCSFVNCRFIANFADVTAGIDVSATGDGLAFESCFWGDTDSTHNYLDAITVATGVDNMSFIDCRFNGLSASNDAFITGIAGDGLIMDGCQIQHNIAQTGVIGQVEYTGNVTNVWIKNCFFRSNVDGAKHIDLQGAANSGGVSNCYFSSLDIAGAVALAINFTGGHSYECYVAGEADTYGIICGGTAYADL